MSSHTEARSFFLAIRYLLQVLFYRKAQISIHSNEYMGVYTVYYIEQTILNRRKYVKKDYKWMSSSNNSDSLQLCHQQQQQTHTHPQKISEYQLHVYWLVYKRMDKNKSHSRSRIQSLTWISLYVTNIVFKWGLCKAVCPQQSFYLW